MDANTDQFKSVRTLLKHVDSVKMARENTAKALELVEENKRLKIENSDLKKELLEAEQWNLEYEDETGDTILCLENRINDLLTQLHDLLKKPTTSE